MKLALVKELEMSNSQYLKVINEKRFKSKKEN